MDVPEIVLVSSGVLIQVLVTLTPGAMISTTDPKLEKLAKLSAESEAATVQAEGSEAGDERPAGCIEFPAATDMKRPVRICQQIERTRFDQCSVGYHTLLDCRRDSSVAGLAEARTTEGQVPNGLANLAAREHVVGGPLDPGDDVSIGSRAIRTEDFNRNELRFLRDTIGCTSYGASCVGPMAIAICVVVVTSKISPERAATAKVVMTAVDASINPVRDSARTSGTVIDVLL